ESTPINSINCLSFSEVLPSEFLKEKTVHVFPDILVVLFSFQGANFFVASQISDFTNIPYQLY
ncbi:hypothetical protein, partial [Virgibacillus indicus]|uniref:hypothetical protein n=1 Tax=Virgibacillus indicus TaxID=2024554 RepID=UPI001980AD5E